MTSETRRETAKKLGDVQADAFRLAVNLQGLHWNVEGPLFYSLHKLTEEQYGEVFDSIDEIAERVRALGLPAPESLASYQERSIIDDLPRNATLEERVERLIADYERATERLKKAVEFAEERGDIKTADLLTDQAGTYEENAWMLRATTA
jgi:starvation-inducible DNA-binding protein